MTTDLHTLVNMHCTNLEISWAGYSPSNKWVLLYRSSNRWCSPKLLLRRIDMRVSALKYIYRHQPFVLADRFPEDIDILSTSLWKNDGYFFFLFWGKVFTSDATCHQGLLFGNMRGRIWYIYWTYDGEGVTACRLHFFSLVMTSTPVSICIRIRFSEYSTVPAMITAGNRQVREFN